MPGLVGCLNWDLQDFGVPVIVRCCARASMRFLTASSTLRKLLATRTRSKTFTTPSPLRSGAASPNAFATMTRSKMLTMPSVFRSAGLWGLWFLPSSRFRHQGRRGCAKVCSPHHSPNRRPFREVGFAVFCQTDYTPPSR